VMPFNAQQAAITESTGSPREPACPRLVTPPLVNHQGKAEQQTNGAVSGGKQQQVLILETYRETA